MQNIILYGLTAILLIVSFFKSKAKTKESLQKAWKSFKNILAPMLGILTSVGLIIAVLNPKVISQIIGGSSGYFGVGLAAIIGSITLIPGFIAFPTASILLENGAGYMQIGAFVSSLMMVGLLTIPIEIKFFNKKSTLIRNGLAFVFSIFVAFIIGKVVG